MKDRPVIAVVGMAGIFPGAPDLDTFWHNIMAGVDACAPVRPERWPLDPREMVRTAPAPDRAYGANCCLLDDLGFDPHDFDLDDDFSGGLDPLHQLVLQTGLQLAADRQGPVFRPETTGLVLASIALPTDGASRLSRQLYGRAFAARLFAEHLPKEDPPALTAGDCRAARVTAFPAALLARTLGLGGGSYTLDAACASSLFAVKLACDALADGRCDSMLAGGVSRPDCLYTQVGFSQLRALSPTGRCAAFDRQADGLVVGEGCGLLLLKRLDDALHDHDEIYGLIRAIGLSNDMQGSLLAPSVEGQLRAMRRAYDQAGWRPADVDLIECHGAGTPRGDLVEARSLVELWGPSGWRRGQCAIGSVKTNVGHLLTAAGAAGMIKSLLALRHKTLPPAANFSALPADSPLAGSPFRVQTRPAKWKSRGAGTPRRAAVSAFGFGGTNAHLLLEEWQPAVRTSGVRVSARRPQRTQPAADVSVAVVGMAACLGSLSDLRQFQEAVFRGRSIIARRPRQRWRGCDALAEQLLQGRAAFGGYLPDFTCNPLMFNIPPSELPDILVQHLLMLKTAAAALADAGMPARAQRPDMGAVIGMGFDMQAADFHVRWSLSNEVRRWNRERGLGMDDEALHRWLALLQDACAPPLTATRTLGALGSMVASRLARQFGLGGPSFVVSSEALSGLTALDIGVQAIRRRTMDSVLVGAVDLAGDVRNVALQDRLRRLSAGNRVCAFDVAADGSLPGEGAVALVLKPLETALADGNRIYAVIRGTGSASSGRNIDFNTMAASYRSSLRRAVDAAGIPPAAVGYVETLGCGDPDGDRLEARALEMFFHSVPDRTRHACAVGALAPNIGHTGCVAGLAGVVKACLCLYQQILPPLVNFQRPAPGLWPSKRFHFPPAAQYWLHNRQAGPRRALAGAFSTDGNCAHVLLEELDRGKLPALSGPLERFIEQERRRPCGDAPAALFALYARSRDALPRLLDNFSRKITSWRSDGLSLEAAAGRWHRGNRNRKPPAALVLVSESFERLNAQIETARAAVCGGDAPAPDALSGIYLNTPHEIQGGSLAFVYPGSGNTYPGMGRRLGVTWPEILRQMERETPSLKDQFQPHRVMPWQRSWTQAAAARAETRLADDPLAVICGQITYASLMTALLRRLGIAPRAAIGYSLGESSALFALGAWPDREGMLGRMRASDLFSRQLAGPCAAARKAWRIDAKVPFNWTMAMVKRPRQAVREAIAAFPLTRLLIVNSAAECVIGGERRQVQAAVQALAADAVYLRGTTTVHCDAVQSVRDAYRNLHRTTTRPVAGIRFYSCAWARAYDLNPDTAADSILAQALDGFDFPALIQRAYADGVRIFVETGPRASCTRMIADILADRPHLAISANPPGRDEIAGLLHLVARLLVQEVPVDLSFLYDNARNAHPRTQDPPAERLLHLPVGGILPIPDAARRCLRPKPGKTAPGTPLQPGSKAVPARALERLLQNSNATAAAHRRFLQLSARLFDSYAGALQLYTDLHRQVPASPAGPRVKNPPAFSREQCLEFATGSAARVLGPEFAEVDRFAARVRLPDEPLMLVDRILSIHGRKGSLGPGKIVTEHDVKQNAWYLDGGRAPVCIAVEAGQADLFLCAYLGIDLAVRGRRTYRLLDASVTFHRGLPVPNEVVRYEIEIERFVRQGETYLFFFHFDGYIGDQRLISMRSGCAGFFTATEIESSGGIVRKASARSPQPGRLPQGWRPLAPFEARETYDERQIDALRRGALEQCFGPAFAGKSIAPGLRLPGGPMRLIHRVLKIDPAGGRYGLGSIRSQSDIHPEDWFLTCHFVDDRVMPGTLMYECCAHTLRIFLQRMGWLSDHPDTCYEPVAGIASRLKCRGPVTPRTRHVVYEIEVKELGYGPEPYAVADAHMFADDHYIVSFDDLTLKMTNVTQAEIQALWPRTRPGPLFDRAQLEAFARGRPSACFGQAYARFDNGDFVARLPSPPFLFLDRVTDAEPPALQLAPGGWITAEHHVRPSNWYFAADRNPHMPYCVLLECALQSCGWLAAYLGSALASRVGLHFRNLGGQGHLAADVGPGPQELCLRARLTKVSQAADMIIEHFDFEILTSDQPVYTGSTYFGFFTRRALSRQNGIADAESRCWQPAKPEIAAASFCDFKDIPPLTPAAAAEGPPSDSARGLRMPASALRMLDRIEAYIPDGGPHGRGYIRGIKHVNPDEWFFAAHFFQDPVWPGSLGIEAFIQLLKHAALARWPQLAKGHCFSLVVGKAHRWVYRGQVTPQNRHVTVEAVIHRIDPPPQPRLLASGFLKVDGLCIYEMQDFGIALVPQH